MPTKLKTNKDFTDGYEQGRADAFNEILNEMAKSPFANDKATFVKNYIEEQLKEQKKNLTCFNCKHNRINANNICDDF